MNINVENLAKDIIKEGLAVQSSHAYVFPNLENESTVLLALALGEVSRNSDKHVTGVKLTDEQNDTMVKAGVKVLEGSMKPEAYVKKLETLLGIELNAIAKNQIATRLAFSYGKVEKSKSKK